MDHFIDIYQTKADKYHKMISFEDFEENLIAAIEKVSPIQGKEILDLGTGTGRLPLIFKDLTSKICALDINFPMILEQQVQMRKSDRSWNLVQGDIRLLPITDEAADITTAGWAAGHFCGWYPNDWPVHIDLFVEEMLRVTKPGGTLFIMETMGTGQTLPAPPTSALSEYYERIETKWEFQRDVIRTDYKFNSLEEAKENTTFFFGEALAEQIDQNNWQTLPEWTAVWHHKK